MTRVPSLRELRASLPPNVAILPTAATRQVQQQWNKATRAARRALRDQHPWPGEYLLPGQRRAISRAQAINQVKQTPELRLAFAILASLDLESRKKVVERLAVEALSGSPEAQQALAIGQCASMTVGESVDMDFAFNWISASLSDEKSQP